MANPFLVLGGIAVGLVTATFGVLQVPGWVASAQDAAAINDLSNLNQAQAVHLASGGTFAAEIGSLAGPAEASPFDLTAPVATLAMSRSAAVGQGTTFHLSGGVTLSHLGINGTGDAYCAVVESASGRFFGITEANTISDASADVWSAMNGASCETEARGAVTGPPPGTGPGTGSGGQPAPTSIAAFTFNTALADCLAPGLNFGASAPDAKINWGDGTVTQATAGQNAHTFATPGTYKVTVDGKVPSFGGMGYKTAPCIVSMDEWGALTGTTSAVSMFQDAYNLESVAAPPATVKDMTAMFRSTVKFNQDISGWNVSGVETMNNMFTNATAFNAPIDKWDVSNVKSMMGMFQTSRAFNQPLDGWKTGNVTTMASMFASSKAFNQDVSSWDVSKVTSFKSMFMSSVFNQPLNAWKTDSATDLSMMFTMNMVFNQDLSDWNVSKVTTTAQMFDNAKAFNGKLAWKDTGSLLNASKTFYAASAFNQDLNTWNVSKVTTMSGMFGYTAAFQGDVSNWTTSSVTDVSQMFMYANKFKGNLTGWNVDAVKVFTSFNTGSALTKDLVPAKIFR